MQQAHAHTGDIGPSKPIPTEVHDSNAEGSVIPLSSRPMV